jgi:hypothetical protein
MALKDLARQMVSEAPARMTLYGPNGEPIVRNVSNGTSEECWIELYPSQSEVGRAIDRRLLDKALRRRTTRASARDVEQNVLEKLVHLTKAWSIAMPDGTPIDEPCTPDNVMVIYSGVQWVRDQVSNFVNDLGNFQATPLGNSSTSPNMSSDSAA